LVYPGEPLFVTPKPPRKKKHEFADSSVGRWLSHWHAVVHGFYGASQCSVSRSFCCCCCCCCCCRKTTASSWIWEEIHSRSSIRRILVGAFVFSLINSTHISLRFCPSKPYYVVSAEVFSKATRRLQNRKK